MGSGEKNMYVSWDKLGLHRLISHGPDGPLLLFFGPLVRYLIKRQNKNAKMEGRIEGRMEESI